MKITAAATLALAPLALAGCTTVRPADPPPEGSSEWLALGETANLGPDATPLELVEDSRCPQGTQCVWAGRVVVETRVTYAGGSQEIVGPFTLGEPVPVADGTMTLVAVYPTKTAEAIAPAEYRFAYRFDGGY